MPRLLRKLESKPTTITYKYELLSVRKRNPTPVRCGGGVTWGDHARPWGSWALPSAPRAPKEGAGQMIFWSMCCSPCIWMTYRIVTASFSLYCKLPQRGTSQVPNERMGASHLRSSLGHVHIWTFWYGCVGVLPGGILLVPVQMQNCASRWWSHPRTMQCWFSHPSLCITRVVL